MDEKTTQEMHSEHQLLHQSLQKLAGKIEDTIAKVDDLHGFTEDFMTSLGDFHKQLLGHFQAEEEKGIFDFIIQKRPEKERTAKELQQEHIEIQKAVEGLQQLIAQLNSQVKKDFLQFKENFNSFAGQFRDHEEKENATLTDIYYLDAGGRG